MTKAEKELEAIKKRLADQEKAISKPYNNSTLNKFILDKPVLRP